MTCQKTTKSVYNKIIFHMYGIINFVINDVNNAE